MTKGQKLPKQWKHWAQKAGLRCVKGGRWGRGRWSHSSLIGKGRHWRVNCHGEFQCSCPTEHFDRWANSYGAGMYGMPRTEAEFLAAVKTMREASKGAT